MQRFVNASSLNFRSSPTFGDNIIDSIHLGYPVDVLEPADGQFVKARVRLGGEEREGYLSAYYLREPVSAGREALVAAAIAQWKRFNFGLGKETKEPYFRYIGEMWEAIGLELDGRDNDVPWSAAAISFMVRKASEQEGGDLYPGFKFAAAHSRYVHDAIKRRDSGDTSAPFWGYDLHEKKPQLGDMVCRGRAGVSVDFEFASRDDAFKSHCDIIVAIRDDFVLTLGGNVSNSVKTTHYDLTANGFLDDTKAVYAMLFNRH